jgi:hypothetical protein
MLLDSLADSIGLFLSSKANLQQHSRYGIFLLWNGPSNTPRVRIVVERAVRRGAGERREPTLPRGVTMLGFRTVPGEGLETTTCRVADSTSGAALPRPVCQRSRRVAILLIGRTRPVTTDGMRLMYR